MTSYALDLIDYIENHGGSGRLLAELYADESFTPAWRERQQQPNAVDSGFSVTESLEND